MQQDAAQNLAGRSRFRYLTDRENFLGLAFLLPAVIYIIALVGIPFILAILFSLSDVNVGDTNIDITLLDFENFERVMKTPQFQRALSNTFVFTFISQIIIIVLANILALVLSQDFRGKWLARALIILPWATPIALGALGWLWLLDSKFSPFDWILQSLNLLGPGTPLGPGKHLNYLGREGLAMASVILVHVWRMLPLSAVILLAGLTSIDKDVLDQAEVDGSGFWRTLFQIKLPLILPIMSIAVLFSTVFTFGDMTVVYILTRGAPIYYTHVLSTWAFEKGIEGGALGEGAATALFLFPVLLGLVILILRISRRTEVT